MGGSTNSWDDNEIYLSNNSGEIQLDTRGDNKVVTDDLHKSVDPTTRLLEYSRGLGNKLARFEKEIGIRKGTPPIVRPPLKPNPSVIKQAPQESALPTEDLPELQGAPDLAVPENKSIILKEEKRSTAPLISREEPSSDVHDQTNPIPAEEVATYIVPPPTNNSDFEALVQRTLRNEPEPGQKHPSHGQPVARKTTADADPVDLFMGAFTVSVVDLVVPTAHIPIVISRSYRSGRPYFGPFGYGWDHDYNVYLRVLDTGSIALWTGKLQEQHFIPANGGLEPKPGFAAKMNLIDDLMDVYEVQFRGGLNWHFERPSGWSNTERIPLTIIRDRHGHTVHLRYDTKDQLVSVLDPIGRGLLFSYGSCNLLERVSDHTGTRIVSYWHDNEIEHLVRVVLPATAQYPKGLSTTYEYDCYNAHPAMQHNILRIHDADNRLMVENEFAGPEVGWEFNSVVRQRFAGFEYGFEYQQIQYVWPDPVNVDALASRTLVRRPDGSLHTYTFNYRGDLLDHRFRLIRDGSYRIIARQWEYDAEGNVTKSVGSDGLRKFFQYDSTNLNPCARHNLLRVRLAYPFSGIMPDRTVYKAFYEPKYQLITQITDEVGAETKYFYDFNGNPTGSGKLVRIQFQAVVDAEEQPQQSNLLLEYNPKGQLSVFVKPEGGRTELTYFSGGVKDGFLLKTTQDHANNPLTSKFDYDAAGFTKLIEEPGGRITGFTFNALGQIEIFDGPEVDGKKATVHQWFDDSGSVIRMERPVGSSAKYLNSGTTIVDEYERDQLGNIHRATLGANTNLPKNWLQSVDHDGRPVKIWDGAGTRTDRCFGENGVLLSETIAASESEAQTTKYTYDRAGRLKLICDPWKKTRTFDYDLWGRLESTTLQSETDLVKAVKNFVYDKNDVLREIRIEEIDLTGAVLPRLLERQTYEYDKRSRLIASISWSFREDSVTVVPLKTRYVYDRDDQLRRILLPRGAQVQYEFDQLGRSTKVNDPHGNVRQFTYNASGDLSESTLISVNNGVTQKTTRFNTFDARSRLTLSEYLGTQTKFKYDDRNYVIEQTAPNGVINQLQFDVFGQVVENVVDAGGLALSSRFDYDLNGRLHWYIDPTTQATVWMRDLFGRTVSLKPPDGTTWEYFTQMPAHKIEQHMPSGNKVIIEYEKQRSLPTKLVYIAAPGQDAVADHEFVYDSLGRVVSASTGSEVILRKYDSFNRLIEETARGKTVRMEFNDVTGTMDLVFPDGRVERTNHNSTGQPTSVILITPGDLGGTTGEVLLQIDYSPAGLPVLLIYPNGVRGQLVNDDQGRVIRIEYQKDSVLIDSCRLRYNENGHRAVVQYLGAPAKNLVHSFDGKERLVEARMDFPLAPLSDVTSSMGQFAEVAMISIAASGAPGVAFSLDDADVRMQVKSLNGGGTNETYVATNDHRVIAVGSNTISYNADGHRIKDGQYNYQLDALNRVTQVSDHTTGTIVAELNYDALSRVVSGTTNGKPFERWFAGSTRIQEEIGLIPKVQQQSPHPIWPMPLYVLDETGTAFIHSDEGWSTMCVTDETGAILERHRYNLFGESTVFEADGVTPLALPRIEPYWRGMPALGTTGLYSTAQRLYDSGTGMFISRDPLLYTDSPSPYAYAAHNPVDFADPSGFAKSALGSGSPTNTSEPESRTGLSKWLYEDSKGLGWYSPPRKGDLFTENLPVDTGSTIKNFGWNILISASNLFMSAINTPFEMMSDIDQAMNRSPFQKEWEAMNAMGPMMKTMGLAAELPGGLQYLNYWISNNKSLNNLALLSLSSLGIPGAGGFGSGAPLIRSAAQASVRGFESGLINVYEGSLGFQSYNTASSVSKAVGFTGLEMEAAHIVPQAIGAYIPGYSPGRALTTYLPKVGHGAWDRVWTPQWNAAIKNKTPMNAGQVFTMLDNALSVNPELSASVKGTISWRLHQEMFSDFGLLWNTPILP